MVVYLNSRESSMLLLNRLHSIKLLLCCVFSLLAIRVIVDRPIAATSSVFTGHKQISRHWEVDHPRFQPTSDLVGVLADVLVFFAVMGLVR